MGKERGLTPREVGEIREARLCEVARILALDGLLVGELPDGGLARCDLNETAAVISDALRSLRPQVVISHDPRGVNAHPDHIATHWALRHALLGHAVPRFAMVAYLPSMVEAVKPRLLFATGEEEIDAVLHLSEREIDAKESALRVHEALVTLKSDGDPDLIRRPPVERYDFLGEEMPEPVSDLFENLPSGGVGNS
jgi:LmbE family N-acetylglucosaminyl deacetylase